MDAQTMKRRAGELAAQIGKGRSAYFRALVESQEDMHSILRAVAGGTVVTEDHPSTIGGSYGRERLVIEGRSDG